MTKKQTQSKKKTTTSVKQETKNTKEATVADIEASIILSIVAVSSWAVLSPMLKESFTSSKALTKPSSANLCAFSKSLALRRLKANLLIPNYMKPLPCYRCPIKNLIPF
jgi:hypothetical protein